MRRYSLVGLLACALARAEPHQMEFIYINANEGTASGGHAALRFDRDVYHFQHVPPGLLRITRDDFQRFRALYGEAENRTLFGHRIAVSDETWMLLRDGFNRRLLIEDEHFEQLEALERDRRLLKLHLAQASDPAHHINISLKGAGLFAPPELKGLDVDRPKGIERLLERIQSTPALPNPNVLAARVRWELEHPRALDELPNAADLDKEGFQPARYGYAERYHDGLSALYALQVLERGGQLKPGALLRPRSSVFALTPSQLAGLRDFRDRLETSLTKLPASPQGHWGYALLVGMARLIAIDTSLESGRLVVLNLASPGPGPRRSSAARRAPLEFKAAMSDLEGPAALDERAYGRLERSANLLIHGENPSPLHPARLPALSLLPENPGAVMAITPRIPRAQLAGQAARLEVAEQSYRARLAELYPYALITNNCVTELFHSVDRILSEAANGDTQGDETAGEAESRRRLGGYVSAGFPNNIPFVAFRSVAANWNVMNSRELPSWRHQRLEDARRETGWLADARESNVISASLYRWHPGDAAFLMFSDAQPWLGLVSGPVNAAVGLGQGLAGLLTLPWDGGSNLRQGAKGFLISLPETVLLNIRKGSYPEFQP